MERIYYSFEKVNLIEIFMYNKGGICGETSKDREPSDQL